MARAGSNATPALGFLSALGSTLQPLRWLRSRCVRLSAVALNGQPMCQAARRCVCCCAVVSIALPVCLLLCRWGDFCAVACNGAAWWWLARLFRAQSGVACCWLLQLSCAFATDLRV